MRTLSSAEALGVAGGLEQLEEITVRGQRFAPWPTQLDIYQEQLRRSLGMGTGVDWRVAQFEAVGFTEDPNDGDDVKIPKPDFCVDGLFLSKNSDSVNLNENWKQAFQYMSAQQLNELAASLQSIKVLAFPESGTGGWQLKLPLATPQSLLDEMIKEAREAAKLSPDARWAYGGNFGDLLTNGMKTYSYIPWLNLTPQLAKIFGKSCSRGA